MIILMFRSKPVILVDGSFLMHKFFCALPMLSTSTGEPTGAIYGIVKALKNLLIEYQPEYMAVIFDAPGTTFRHELFPHYKANRPPLAIELRQQVLPMFAFISAMGIKILQLFGVEADDVIATLAHKASQELALAVLIVSGDKDLLQLVNDTTVVTNNKYIIDTIGVQKKFGVLPSLIVDWLALVGDITDNIPGIRGIGAVTATKLLQQYGSLECIIKHANNIHGKIGERVRAGREKLILNRKLVTLNCHVSIPCDFDAIKINQFDKSQLDYLYKRYEFKLT